MSQNYFSNKYVNTTDSAAFFNNSNATSDYLPMDIAPLAKQAMYAANVFIFLTGIPGNVIVIFIFGYQKRMERSFDVYVVSLAFADVLASFFVPITTIHDLMTDLLHWNILGGFGCKLFVSMDHLTMLASVFTLLVISVERVRVIARSKMVVGHQRSRRHSLYVVVLLWLSAIIIVSPFTSVTKLVNGQCTYRCTQAYMFIYYAVYTTFTCFLPLCLIVAMRFLSDYVLQKRVIPGEGKSMEIRRKQQYLGITKIFSVIAVLFFLLTGPGMVVSFVVSYYGTFKPEVYWKTIELAQPLHYFTYTLSHFNSCINPFIYAQIHRFAKKFLTKLLSVQKTHFDIQNSTAITYRTRAVPRVSLSGDGRAL